jgi:signal transduction histidine kinase
MLSPLTVISIFTEIFVCGILLSGIYSFVRQFWARRQTKSLLLALLFLSLLIFAVLTILSQAAYNLDRPVSQLEILQKYLTGVLAITAYLILLFLGSKFDLKKFNWLIFTLFLPIAYLIFLVFSSRTSFTFRREIIDPLVNFSNLPPLINPLLTLPWGLLGIFYLAWSYLKGGPARMLLLFSGLSALLISSLYLWGLLYINLGNPLFLLSSWVALLLGSLGLMLGELIPPDSEFAAKPLSLLRSRVLFKLLYIFVLLIIILFEITTVITIEISKSAVKRQIFNNYLEIARGVAANVEEMPSLDPGKLQRLVEERTQKARAVYIIDRSGRILAHPDPITAKLRVDLSSTPYARQLLAGRSGAEEFPADEGLGLEEKVGAFYPIHKFGGGVIVDEPLREAYAEMRQLETNSLLFIIAGIVLTVTTGVFFAQSLERPIHKLIEGAQAVAKGDLNYQISVSSIDEIGSLAKAFNKMTRDLKDSQEKLIMSEKLASLGTLAAGMAHEIKNPLVSLRTFSQLLMQKWEDQDFRDKFAQIVPSEIERINKIAESLLKFGRPVKPELTQVNLNSLLEEILQLLEGEARKNNVRFTTKFAELPEITGDASQLNQAFLNIILNAVQAMAETGKGGEVLVKTDVGEVVKLGPLSKAVTKETGEVVWEAEEAKPQPVPAVFIEITDTGPGIEPDKIKQLFDPFFTTKIKGTGMGLPITLKIIEEHKGSIKVKSEAGRGTTFLVTLPQQLEKV